MLFYKSTKINLGAPWPALHRYTAGLQVEPPEIESYEEEQEDRMYFLVEPPNRKHQHLATARG